MRTYAANRRTPGRELSEDRLELPFNRSVVRRADSFLVHSEWMRERILAERNAVTPISVVPHGAERVSRSEDHLARAHRVVDEYCHWSIVARRYAEALEAFPPHRTNRKSLIQAAVADAHPGRPAAP